VAPRLLFDQNLAPRLARDLAALYPDSTHVRELGLAAGTDDEVWAAAATGGFVVVTKDDDFRQRAFLRGAPPKVLWLRVGNCRTEEVATLLRERHAEILRFADARHAAVLVLGAR
jgi:predicted nuclease of predicted toxin-antitoxin system